MVKMDHSDNISNGFEILEAHLQTLDGCSFDDLILQRHAEIDKILPCTNYRNIKESFEVLSAALYLWPEEVGNCLSRSGILLVCAAIFTNSHPYNSLHQLSCYLFTNIISSCAAVSFETDWKQFLGLSDNGTDDLVLYHEPAEEYIPNQSKLHGVEINQYNLSRKLQEIGMRKEIVTLLVPQLFQYANIVNSHIPYHECLRDWISLVRQELQHEERQRLSTGRKRGVDEPFLYHCSQ